MKAEDASRRAPEEDQCLNEELKEAPKFPLFFKQILTKFLFQKEALSKYRHIIIVRPAAFIYLIIEGFFWKSGKD